jgi:hypothetical protein
MAVALVSRKGHTFCHWLTAKVRLWRKLEQSTRAPRRDKSLAACRYLRLCFLGKTSSKVCECWRAYARRPATPPAGGGPSGVAFLLLLLLLLPLYGGGEQRL